MREYAIVLALLSAALFAWVLGSQADEIALRDFFVFAAALAVILTVQLLLLYFLDKRIGVVAPGRKDLILLVVTAVLVASNAYFLAFYTLEQPTAYRIACAVVVGAVFLALMSVPRLRPVLALFAGVMLVMSLIQYGYARGTLAMTAPDVPEDTESLPVNSKRNVYIIGMESLQSPTAYRENYGIQDPEYVKVLRDIGFRVLERAYSAERSTLRTWGTIFEFKRCVRNCPDRESDLGIREVFVTDNSTFRSFRDSNYGIQFLYKNNYFPINPKRVDYFFPPPGFDACDELGAIYFYGLCSPKVVGVINRFVFHSEKIGWKAQIKVLEKRTDFITEAANASRPWFTWTHIKFPGHTSGNYRYPDPKYMEKFKKSTREGMAIIAEGIETQAELETLVSLGVPFGQGYYLAEPAPR